MLKQNDTGGTLMGVFASSSIEKMQRAAYNMHPRPPAHILCPGGAYGDWKAGTMPDPGWSYAERVFLHAMMKKAAKEGNTELKAWLLDTWQVKLATAKTGDPDVN
jgi:hypothetical protein